MIFGTPFSNGTLALLGGLGLMSICLAPAQALKTAVRPPEAAVPLVSGSCPAVRPNGTIALDWNPGFDHAGAVTGLRSFRLIFHPLRQDGVNPDLAVRLVVDHLPGGRMTPVGNGYYRLEARLPHQTRLGTYQLAEAHTSPLLSPDYQGEEPQASVSPVRDHLCMQVVGSPAVAEVPLSASLP